MTKSQRAARFDRFCSNDDNFVAVEYSDQRAVAIRNAASKRNAHKNSVQAAREIETSAQAASFSLGQSVYRSNRRALGLGTIVAISGSAISVDFGGKVSKFIASAVTPA